MKPVIRFPWDFVTLFGLVIIFGIIIDLISPLGWFSYWLGAGLGVVVFALVDLFFIDMPDFIDYEKDDYEKDEKG
jgi:hypothetical protein